MFKQIPTPLKEDLNTTLGPDFADQWDHDKVTLWLEEHGWGHIASTFRECNISGEAFFNITLATLVDILPRKVTTYAERRRLLNDIRALGHLSHPTGVYLLRPQFQPTQISINTNVYHATATYTNDPTTRSPSLPSAGTPTSGHLASNSPTTPLSASRCCDYHPNAQNHINDYPKDGSGFTFLSRPSASALSPSPSPSSSEYPAPSQRSIRVSPTRTYSPKAAFSKIRNTFLHHGMSSSNTAPTSSLSITTSALGQNHHYNASSAPFINPRTHSTNDATIALEADIEERKKHHSATPVRFSSTPDKISKLWAHWRTPGHNRISGSSKGQSHPSIPSLLSSSGDLTASPVSEPVSAFAQYSKMPMKKATVIGMSAQRRFSELRIQVTGDKETWYSVVVTDIQDPDTLRDRILKRMSFTGNPDLYCYFHENGPDPDMPLNSQDLMYLCSIADHSANQRIFVCHATECPTPEQQQQQEQQQHYQQSYSPHRYQRTNDISTYDYYHQNGLYGNSNYSLSTPELGHSPSETPLSPYLQSFNNAEFGRVGSGFVFFASSASRDEPVGIQLSDPPTPCYSDESHPLFKNQTDDAHYPPSPLTTPSKYRRQRTGSAPYIHEPSSVAAKAIKTWTRRSEPGFDRPYQAPLSANALWAVPPKPNRGVRTCAPLTNDESTYRRQEHEHKYGHEHEQRQQEKTPAMPSQKIAAPHVQLWAVPPPHVSVHPLERHDGTIYEESPGADPHYLLPEAPVSPLSPHDYWGERPPAEVVCQNMDKYFKNHDLDKEIILDDPLLLSSTTTVPIQEQQQPNLARRLTHTKSIRVVAREASKKYNRARKASAAFVRDGSRLSVNGHGQGVILRRKSTKLWGQRVVEVKPDETIMPRLNEQEYSMSMTDQHGETKLVQWIRGKLIGKGSFGRVYLAFNVATREVIAVKQVEIPKTKSDLLDSHRHDMVDALYQEIAMLRDLDHDNIVQYLGYGKDDQEGVVNIFLEYVSGGSIASRLALHGALDESLVRYFTHQILMGLEYLHARGILHRDIKAANILVEADGICKISDFGLSKKNDYDEAYDQNSRMSLRGSVYWMAPEVVKNQPYSAKVDIWSLGCTVIEMFTGQRPWLTLNQIAALYNLGCQKSPQVPENISKDARNFLNVCFTIDPNKRPTAAELLNHPFCRSDPLFEFTDYIDKGKI